MAHLTKRQREALDEVVPPILTCEEIVAIARGGAGRGRPLADLAASHEALRAQRDALRQALTDLIRECDEITVLFDTPAVARARAVLAGEP